MQSHTQTNNICHLVTKFDLFQLSFPKKWKNKFNKRMIFADTVVFSISAFSIRIHWIRIRIRIQTFCEYEFLQVSDDHKVTVTLEVIERRLMVFCWSCDEGSLKWDKKINHASSLPVRIEWVYCTLDHHPIGRSIPLKVHKIEIFFGFDFEISIISLLVMWKY